MNHEFLNGILNGESFPEDFQLALPRSIGGIIIYSIYSLVECVCFSFSFFLGPHLQHMEVPRLGVESELHLLAYATATAIHDPRYVCDLHHSSQQHQIL